MYFTRSSCNSWRTFGSRNSDLARTWFAKAGNTSVEYGCGVLDPLPSDCSNSVQRWAYVSCSSSTRILCNMMHDLIMIPKSAMSHKRADSRMILNRVWSTRNARSMSFRHPSWCFANNYDAAAWSLLRYFLLRGAPSSNIFFDAE